MTFFTKDEFVNKYPTCTLEEEWKIEGACEKIYEQIGLGRRGNWDITNVPTPVKNASMEQLRFMLEYDIPCLDNRGKIKAGAMARDLISDSSKNALRMLGNGGYLYRGNPLNHNMGMNLPFGS